MSEELIKSFFDLTDRFNSSAQLKNKKNNLKYFNNIFSNSIKTELNNMKHTENMENINNIFNIDIRLDTSSDSNYLFELNNTGYTIKPPTLHQWYKYKFEYCTINDRKDNIMSQIQTKAYIRAEQRGGEDIFYKKYLKYKNKYNNLKK
jgi:hypothetical protein